MTVQQQSPTAIVRSVLRDRPGVYVTAHSLILMTGLTSGQINVAITALLKQGAIQRLWTADRGSAPQAYRWGDGNGA